MPSDPTWYTRIWEYFSSVIGFWQFWVAVAFMMERAFERYLPEVAGKVNPYFTPERRRRFFVWFGVAAFVYANFRAFDGERQEKERLLYSHKVPSLASSELYQNELRVASVHMHHYQAMENILVFDTVVAPKPLDMSVMFEFVDWKLSCEGEEVATNAAFTYRDFICRVQGQR